MIDRLESMRVFITAISEGSMARAGRRLGRSPAAVTRAVAALENHVGTALLYRSTRKLQLTEAGERYAAVCRHVLAELDAYHDLVSRGSYIVATDGSMKDLYDVPRGKPEWKQDNPTAAALEFAKKHPEFVIEQPAWPFNDSDLKENITHWPGAWLRRLG